MTTIAIQALGPLVTTLPNAPLNRIPKKGQALLVYLATHKVCRRDGLAELLWPRQDIDQARHSLRNCLMTVRHETGNAVENNRSKTECSVSASIDITNFEKFATSTSIKDLTAAMDLYRGDFLEGFEIESDPWEEWCSSERNRLRETAGNVAKQISLLSIAARDHDCAIAMARRAVAIDQFDEAANRALITAYLTAGRRRDAICQYNNFEQLMVREMGVAPEKATREILGYSLGIVSDLRRLAAQLSHVLEGHTKINSAAVRESMRTMAVAADALQQYRNHN